MAAFDTNRRVAQAFIRMAQLLDGRGENPYRARAYRRGAESVSSCREPIEQLAAQGRLESLAGIGEDLASKIAEVLESGTFPAYELLVRQADPQVQALIQAGLSPELALLVDAYRRRDALDELHALAASHLLRSLPGVTRSHEVLILDWVTREQRAASRS
jgi:DNA polymerase (family 10)